MTQPPRRPNLKDTPGGIITHSAFTYAVAFYQFADTKYPILKQYPIEARHAAHQAAIVVSALVLLERSSGGAGWKGLHEEVANSFAPSARHRCLTAVKALSAYLMKLDRDTLTEIPSMAPLAAADDKKLADGLTAWLGGTIMDKWTLGAEHLPIAAAMARSAKTSAVMIVRKIKR